MAADHCRAMAHSGRRTVQILALLGLLGLSQASWGREHFFHLAPLEKSGCLPKNFERLLPPALTVAAWACRRLHWSGTSSRRHFHRPGAYDVVEPEGKAIYLECLARKLDITNDSGVDKAKLIAFVETLFIDNAFAYDWKQNVNICLDAMSSELISGQQGVYILTCLKKRLLIGCAMLGHKPMCLKATCLSGLSFSSKSPGLVKRSVWLKCKRQVQRMGSAFTNPDKKGTDFCPELYDKVRAIAACALRESSLTANDALNVTAAQNAIKQGDNSRDAYQMLTLLESCKDTALDAFLACWSDRALEQCATSEAHQLAALLLPAASNTIDPRTYGEWDEKGRD